MVSYFRGHALPNRLSMGLLYGVLVSREEGRVLMDQA